MQWYVEAENLGGLQIDYQFELGRPLNRQIAGIRTLQDAIDVPCRLAELFRQISSVSDEAAGFRKDGTGVDRWNAGVGSQRNDRFTICIVEYVRHHNETATGVARLRGDNARDLVPGVNRRNARLDGKG